MTIHVAGILGLIVIFVLGTLRPVNLGVLALAMTFVVGSLAAREAPAEMYRGFPVDLFVLLTGVTYLFAIAERNGTLARIVEGSVRLAHGRRRLIPWVVFAIAAAPAMAGAIGSAGVALLAPISMRLAERCAIDRRLIGLMVVHGAAAGNFSPLNVLGAIVLQAVTARGAAALRLGSLSPPTSSTTSCLARSSSRSSAGGCVRAPEAAPLRTHARPRASRIASIDGDRTSSMPARCWPSPRSPSSHWDSASASASSRSPLARCCSWRLRARRAAPSARWRGRRAAGLRDRDLRRRAAALRHGGRCRPRHSRRSAHRSSWRCCCAPSAR